MFRVSLTSTSHPGVAAFLARKARYVSVIEMCFSPKDPDHMRPSYLVMSPAGTTSRRTATQLRSTTGALWDTRAPPICCALLLRSCRRRPHTPPLLLCPDPARCGAPCAPHTHRHSTDTRFEPTGWACPILPGIPASVTYQEAVRNGFIQASAAPNRPRASRPPARVCACAS